MDILAARKKAAERSREQKAKEAVPQAPAEPEVPPVREELAAFPPVPETAGDQPAEPLREPAPAIAAEKSEAPVEELEMLSFRLGSEEYAVLVDDVKEVLKKRDLTPVPNAPDVVLGVTALRGPILPVLDLRKRLGLGAGGSGEKSRILVLTVNDEDTGVVVDRVTGVVRIHPETIRPVPETIEHGAEYLKGIARRGDKLYILLDIEKALGA